MIIPFINRFLKNERKKRGLTQEKTASLIFKSKPTIARYDSGDIIPESVLRQLCKMLNLDFFELLIIQDAENAERSSDSYSDLIEKYKNPNTVIIPPSVANINLNPNEYNVESLKTELLNYLNFKDEFLKLKTTEEEKSKRIEKILSFIDFLYFQDIIKK